MSVVKMKEIKVKSPTRIDLTGGFLDIPPVYSLIDDCCVVNCSIPVFSSVTFKSKQAYRKPRTVKSSDFLIQASSPAGHYNKSFSSIRAFLKSSDKKNSVLQKILTYWLKEVGEEILSGLLANSEFHIESESPIGAGLGGSSSLCVSLNKLFISLLNKKLNDKQVVQLCRDIETKLLHFPAGVQDYIPALKRKTEMLYIIRFTPFGPQWMAKKISKAFFKEHLLLVDTKIEHHSGKSNWKILKRVIEGDKEILKVLNQLKENSLKMALSCESGKAVDWGRYLRTESSLKKRYFQGWSNKKVSEVMNLVLRSGASAVKLCGAGGGGCMLIFCENVKNKNNVKKVCIKHNIPIILSW